MKNMKIQLENIQGAMESPDGDDGEMCECMCGCMGYVENTAKNQKILKKFVDFFQKNEYLVKKTVCDGFTVYYMEIDDMRYKIVTEP